MMKKMIEKFKYDKTSLELLGIAISFMGLFASIFNISSGTEYYAIFGHDLKHYKADFMNSYVSNWFLLWAILGVLLQLCVKVFDIGDDKRTMTKNEYFTFTIIFILFSLLITLSGAQVSNSLAKNNFKKVIVADFVTDFEEFEFMLTHDWLMPNELIVDDEKEKSILKQNNKVKMENTLQYIEELIELKSNVNVNIQSRFTLIKEKLNFERNKKRIKILPQKD